ncbi:MAG TPA: aldo/keto reductase [Bacteroidales bacterium]|nr:aldo/keto reductase [Bacteroidales bacterium]
MKNMNRRSFIRTGAAGAAGVLAFSKSAASVPVSRQEQEIITRTLGRTGMKVPVISFGVMRSDNPNLCKAAHEKGIRLFDTANGYQNGNNETMLGNLFKTYQRNSFYLATKVKPAGVDRDGKPTAETTADDFLSKFNTSISRLQMDYVDILYIHDIRNPEMLEYKPIISAVKKLKKDGKVKFIGFSTHANEPQVINAAADLKTFDVILTSYNFKQAYANELTEAIHKAGKAGIGIVAMKTLAGGGFLDKEKTKKVNTSAAIKWVLSNEDVSTVIPGMTEFDHLDANLKLLSDLSITDSEKQDLVLAMNEQGLFCTQCQECLRQCPRRLPVNDLMRAYMYAYGYSNMPMAHSLLSELNTGTNPCGDCSSCQVSCTKRFDLKEKIADISRLAAVPGDFIV